MYPILQLSPWIEGYDQSKPPNDTVVGVSLVVAEIDNVDDEEQTLEVTATVQVEWQDERLIPPIEE